MSEETNVSTSPIVAAIAVLCAFTTQAAADPVAFRDPDGVFTAEFPRAPDVRNSQTKLADGTLVPLTTYVIDDGAVAMVVMVGDFTQLPDANVSDLDSVAQAASASFSSKTFTTIDRDRQPGRDVTGVNPSGLQISDQVFALNRRLYQVITGCPSNPSAAQIAEVAAFKASFHFLPH